MPAINPHDRLHRHQHPHPRSRAKTSYFPILDAVVAGRLDWTISNRIFSEYEEIVTATAGSGAWAKLELLMNLIDVTTGNLIRVSPHFQFRVIGEDPDDNAFTEGAIAAHATT